MTTLLEAVRYSLDDAMAEDESVVLLGQDIGAFGGAFKVTDGLHAKYGAQRVVDTPISESAMIGAAIGASMQGLKPVVEMQFIDFIACGWNMMVNFAAKCHYRWGQNVQLVVRGPCGAGVSGSAFHSQSVEAHFMTVPGIKIAYPSNPADAYALLRSAIDDPNPVLFLEHKFLYRRAKGELARGARLEFGQAKILRRGSDLTIITYGAMVEPALKVAEKLATDGAQVEVVDLRTLVPLDEETILDSVARNSKVILFHEATRNLGPGAELSARIAEKAFEYLDGPPTRIAAPDSPVPFAPALERVWLPGETELISAARRLLDY